MGTCKDLYASTWSMEPPCTQALLTEERSHPSFQHSKDQDLAPSEGEHLFWIGSSILPPCPPSSRRESARRMVSWAPLPSPTMKARWTEQAPGTCYMNFITWWTGRAHCTREFPGWLASCGVICAGYYLAPDCSQISRGCWVSTLPA